MILVSDQTQRSTRSHFIHEFKALMPNLPYRPKKGGGVAQPSKMPPDLTTMIQCFEKLHITEPFQKPSPAEKFINISELRLRLYDEIATSATARIRDFSGFFLASKAVYAEAEAEVVNSRTRYFQAEETEWFVYYGKNFNIEKPVRLRDLNVATVMLSFQMLIEADKAYQSDWFDWLHVLLSEGHRRMLRKVAVDRLEFKICPQDSEGFIPISDMHRAVRKVLNGIAGLGQHYHKDWRSDHRTGADAETGSEKRIRHAHNVCDHDMLVVHSGRLLLSKTTLHFARASCFIGSTLPA